jgi:hypothetical protein
LILHSLGLRERWLGCKERKEIEKVSYPLFFLVRMACASFLLGCGPFSTSSLSSTSGVSFCYPFYVGLPSFSDLPLSAFKIISIHLQLRPQIAYALEMQSFSIAKNEDENDMEQCRVNGCYLWAFP